MTGPAPWATVADLVAERDRLRSINAELVAALQAFLDADPVELLKGNDPDGAIWANARAVLARAAAEGR